MGNGTGWEEGELSASANKGCLHGRQFFITKFLDDDDDDNEK
jgi:hypothetical protein